MTFKDLNLNDLTRLVSQQVDHVTCIECCKYYVIPTTAICGHTLCHSCWRGRCTCPFCSIQVEKRNLKLNLPLQRLTDHVHVFRKTVEEIFKIKLDEFMLDAATDKESDDPNKHVKEWLTSSQNHFSAPVTDSQQSFQGQSEIVEKITSNIQIHTERKKDAKPIEVVHITPVQVDWDKIEEMPEVENSNNKNKENVVGPMDIEPFDFIDEDKEYSNDNPRRSSRQKEYKNDNYITPFAEITSDKNSNKNSNSDNKSHKLGKNWSNVKRMKKEFSKLNKKNKNKLNVSIEMCKKTQIVPNAGNQKPQQVLYDIDDNTQDIDNIDKMIIDNHCNKNIDEEIRDNIDVAINNQNVQNVVDVQLNMSKGSSSYVKNKTNKGIELVKDTNNATKEISNSLGETAEMQTKKVCFFKKSALKSTPELKDVVEENKNQTYPTDTLEESKGNSAQIVPNVNLDTLTANTEDIEITIKIGNTLTNIFIKKKENDVQLKIHSDREIQTSIENDINNKKSVPCSPIIMEHTVSNYNKINEINDVATDNQSATTKLQETPKVSEKSTLTTKKNTASADTATAQFEITESVEQEFTETLGYVPLSCKNNTEKSPKNNCDIKSSTQLTSKKLQGIAEDDNYLNDADIFDGESVKEGNVQSVKASKKTPSAILMPTVKSNKMNSQKDKRIREGAESEDFPITKKIKLTNDSINKMDISTDKCINQMSIVEEHDSENINYDAIMSQVFANIDADMGKKNKTQTDTQKTYKLTCNNNVNTQQTNVSLTTQGSNVEKSVDNSKDKDQKCSENIFSIIEKEIPDSEIFEMSKNKTLTQIQSHKEDSSVVVKSPSLKKHTQDKSQFSQTNDIEMLDFSTPVQDDDSDKSIVEETPQKTASFTKNKNKNELQSNNSQQILSKPNTKLIRILQQAEIDSHKNNVDPKTIINLSDSLEESTKTSKNVTVVETVQPRITLETPLTITKFVDQIKHKSTPNARKSLNFTNQRVDDDPEQTLCPSSIVAAKTTQEKELMRKALNETQNSYTQRSPHLRNKKNAKLCIAGSCLTSSEQANLKLLCIQRNLTYVDKYTEELTHLVVGVDEENKSQRSVKYMCALAGAKWIVTYSWIEKCLQTKTIVDEEPFEALDGTGEPGPRRSRIAKRKLFQGITFFCMPPFSVLDVETLKDILEAAGGRVVSEARGVRAGDTPALLLAEPEHTQEDRFIYLAMELGVVPVNYEWVLNCLGCYTLSPIYELLLCPASLLPPCTKKWPTELISRDFE